MKPILTPSQSDSPQSDRFAAGGGGSADLTPSSRKSSGGGLLTRPKAIGIAVAIVGLLGITGMAFQSGAIPVSKKAAGPTRTPALTVSVQQPTTKPIERLISVHGSVWPWDPISVGATTSGLETKTVLVEEGDLVKKGQTLATLDSSQLQAELTSEKARLTAGIANVSKSIQPNRPEDINALAAEVEQASASVEDQQAALLQAQANLDNARANVTRYQYLKEQGAVSLQEAENRNLAVQVSEAIVRSAQKKVAAAKFVLKQGQERLAMARSGGRKEDIQIAHANVGEIRGNVQKLETQISQTIIKAPVDGLITRRDAHVGDISSVGKSMFLMARDNRLELRAEVPETDLHLIKAGQPVAIDSSLTGSGKVIGRVREISPLVDQSTRLATVRIDVPQGCGLKPGMYAEGHINIGKQLALTVPSQAVISRDEKHSVFVLYKDLVESRPVVVGNHSGDLVEIVSGLKGSEQVVVEGAGFLKDGDSVAVSH
jgi:HlyD family secretion protein